MNLLNVLWEKHVPQEREDAILIAILKSPLDVVGKPVGEDDMLFPLLLVCT